jgi:hypothetical protein
LLARAPAHLYIPGLNPFRESRETIMARQAKDSSFRALFEAFTRELSEMIGAQVREQVALAMRSLPRAAAPAKLDGRRAGRLCPVPGCGEPGAGPRNRWFCRDHSRKLSVAEQKSILARTRRLEAEGKLTPVPAQRLVRLPPKTRKPRGPLDMTCRVDGCTNRSRGPRVGFICDQHRQELSADEQRIAREKYNARLKGSPAAQPVMEAPRAVAPVPPIIRKAEPAEA